MSFLLEQLEATARRAECQAHDAESAAMDARLLHRIPAPDQGKGSEASRRASCAALGLDADAPLAFLESPMVRFWGVVIAAWSGVVSAVWWLA